MGFLMAARFRAPPVVQQTEPMNMDDLEDIMREVLERSSGNSTATSDRSQPSVPSQPIQSSWLLESVETAQQPDRARDTEHRLSTQVAPSPPMSPVACAGAGTIPYPSTKTYQVMVENPFNRKSNVVASDALTNGTGDSTRSASHQASKNPHVKTSKTPENRRSEVVTPVASTSSDCAGASSVLLGSREPYVVIVEQPKPSRRFRYDTEIGSAGAIHGVECTNKKSFPKIKIGNYTGPAVITVSLVCKEKPFKVHPNGIVGKKKLLEEDFTYIYVKIVQVTRKNCVIQFDDLGIRFVKPNQIEEALQLRKAQGVDPFKQGYKFSSKKDDLQAVRLCFQVSLVTQQLDPVVSDVIYHSKKLGCLNIKRMCGCRGKKSGGPYIIFLSKELPKDLEVVFYEEENGRVVWEECVAIFEVYERSAIVCAVPAYTRADVQCDTEVNVSVALRRRSDGERGDPRPFTYSADDTAVFMKKRKVISDQIQQYAEKNWTPPASLLPDYVSQDDQDWQKLPRPFDFNSAMPEPSFVNPAMLGPNSVNPTMAGLFNINSVITGSNSTNPAMLGPISVAPAVAGPNHVTPAEPELNSINTFLPGPSQFQLIQTNILLSPDMDSLSFSENEGVLSPNWHLDTDGGIPSVDTVLAEACANHLDF